MALASFRHAFLSCILASNLCLSTSAASQSRTNIQGKQALVRSGSVELARDHQSDTDSPSILRESEPGQGPDESPDDYEKLEELEHSERINDFHDYSTDASTFLNAHPTSSLASHAWRGDMPCHLQTKNATEAKRLWSSFFEELSEGKGPGPGGRQPWVPGKPPNDEESSLEYARHFFPNKLFGSSPGVVRGLDADWAARKTWDANSMKKRLGHLKLGIESFNYPQWIYTVNATRANPDRGLYEPLSEYLRKNESEHNFLVFVNEVELPDISENNDSRSAMDLLRNDFKPHPFFAATPEEKHSILALDGAGSSHSFHQHAPVWQTQVKGRKGWWFLPPSVKGSVTDHHGVAMPGSAPVVDDDQYTAPNGCAMLHSRKPPKGAKFCVVGPGDTIVLPEDWWHATCALDDWTAAIGGWLIDRRVPDNPDQPSSLIQGHPSPTGPISLIQASSDQHSASHGSIAENELRHEHGDRYRSRTSKAEARLVGDSAQLDAQRQTWVVRSGGLPHMRRGSS